MSKIKFRYKIKERKDLIYDFDDKFGYLQRERKMIAGSMGQIFIIEVEMQYTGLKDKNGKEIYVGDIIHYHDSGNVYKDEYKGIVIFSWRTLQFCVESYSKILKGIRQIPLVSNEHPHFASSKTEIIGNKYDNPELLDAEDKEVVQK